MITMSQHDEHEGHSDHKEISIETLSTPPLKIPPAPLSRRVIAGVIDSSIVASVWILLIFRTSGSIAILSLTDVSYLTMVYLVTITFVYYFVLEGVFASTIGKSLLKLRVLGSDGEACSLRASFKRNALRFLDWLPFLYVVAGIAIAASRDRQRVGDMVAATIVTKAPEKDINPPPAPFLFH